MSDVEAVSLEPERKPGRLELHTIGHLRHIARSVALLSGCYFSECLPFAIVPHDRPVENRTTVVCTIQLQSRFRLQEITVLISEVSSV